MKIEESIEILKNSKNLYLKEKIDSDILEEAIETLLSAYEKEKEKNKTLETLLQGNLYQMYLYYKELAGRYQANSVNKDKIKAKIEEIDIEIQCCEYADDDIEEYKQDMEKEKARLLRDKKILQSLLDKE